MNMDDFKIVEMLDRLLDEGLDYVSAVHRVHDHFMELWLTEKAGEGNPIPCKGGCAHCCRLLTTATPHEWANILKFLQSHPRIVSEIIPKLNTQISRYREVVKAVGVKQTNDVQEYSRMIMQVSEKWGGTDCLFLSQCNTCSIYPVRPLGCRRFTMPTRCDERLYRQPAKQELPYWEQPIQLLLIQHPNGAVAPLPLPYFLQMLESLIGTSL